MPRTRITNVPFQSAPVTVDDLITDLNAIRMTWRSQPIIELQALVSPEGFGQSLDGNLNLLTLYNIYCLKNA